MPDWKGRIAPAGGRYAIIHPSPAKPHARQGAAKTKDFARSSPLVSGLKEASDNLLRAATRFIREGEASSILSDDRRALETYCPFSISEIDRKLVDSPSFSDLSSALERYDAALRKLGKSERKASIGLLETESLAEDADPRMRLMGKKLLLKYQESKTNSNLDEVFSEPSKLIAILVDAGIETAVSARMVASAALRGIIMIRLPDMDGDPCFPEDEIPTKDGSVLP